MGLGSWVSLESSMVKDMAVVVVAIFLVSLGN